MPEVVTNTRPSRQIKPGQAIGARWINNLVRATNLTTAAQEQQFDTGTLRPQIHFLQGTGDFPAVGEKFGVDVFLGRRYELFAYYLTCTGTCTVQLLLNGELTGEVISSANAGQYNELSPHVVYGDNAPITLQVISAGTVSDFALVFDCWRLG